MDGVNAPRDASVRALAAPSVFGSESLALDARVAGGGAAVETSGAATQEGTPSAAAPVATPGAASAAEDRDAPAVAGLGPHELQVAPEGIATWLRQAVPLWEAHWRERERHHDKIALAPDFPKWFALAQAGAVRGYTARTASGELAGYLLFWVCPNISYRDHVFAVCELIYLAPQHRRGHNAARLLRCALDDLIAAGVSKVMIEVPDDHDFSALLSRQGFAPRGRLYERVLI